MWVRTLRDLLSTQVQTGGYSQHETDHGEGKKDGIRGPEHSTQSIEADEKDGVDDEEERKEILHSQFQFGATGGDADEGEGDDRQATCARGDLSQHIFHTPAQMSRRMRFFVTGMVGTGL